MKLFALPFQSPFCCPDVDVMVITAQVILDHFEDGSHKLMIEMVADNHGNTIPKLDLTQNFFHKEKMCLSLLYFRMSVILNKQRWVESLFYM